MAIFLLVLGFTGLSVRASDQWKELINSAHGAGLNEDWQKSESIAKQALAMANKNEPACSQLGEALCVALEAEVQLGKTGRDTETEANYKELLNLLIAEKHGRKIDPLIDVYARALADFYRECKLKITREACLKHSIELDSYLYPDLSNSNYPMTVLLLSSYYQGQGRSNEAVPILISLKDLLAQHSRSKNASLVDVLNAMASTFSSLRRYNDAKQTELECIKIAENSGGSQQKQRVRNFLAFLGVNEIHQGNLLESNKYYALAISHCVNECGPNSSAEAGILYFRGVALRETGKYAEAEVVFKRVLAILDKLPRTKDPMLAYTWEQLYLLYTSTHQEAKIRECHNRAQHERAAIGI
jgi:tetratricopeptide (TPR) repeat protein